MHPLRFGVLACFVVLACWHDDRGSMPIANHLEAEVHDLSGAYWCALDQGATYERYPCVIRKVGERFVLAKLAGSQRFQGTITPTETGFRFAGVFFCPWGACDKPLNGEFRAMQRGELRGTFRDDSMIVLLIPASQSAFGGVSYGGDGYGDPFGRGYKGTGPGGASYGLRRALPRP